MPPKNFTVFGGFKRRKRCCSCKTLIDFGAECLKFFRIKWNEYGNEVDLSSWFMCEKCGEIFLNLDDLGYCIYLGDNMKETLREYWEISGFEPK